MTGLQDTLRAAGIWYGNEARPKVRFECARLARVVRERGIRRLGLAPAADDVAVPALAIELARALVGAPPDAVGVVDALGRWSGTRAGHSESQAATWRTAAWLVAGVAVIAPVTADPATGLLLLRAVVEEESAGFSRLVVDLTGFDRLGERRPACELLDGVAVVARSGVTRTRQIVGALAEIPDGGRLGVLLSGL